MEKPAQWTTSLELPTSLTGPVQSGSPDPPIWTALASVPGQTEPTCHALDRPVNDPLREPICRSNVVGASTWKGVVGLVNNQRTCEVAAH